ncbi:hypothetical protein TNCV_1743731 [Trichonephila clavipes]|nr:hypothetical protein TNCV_1743731 [Trichonephila clavipes]
MKERWLFLNTVEHEERFVLGTFRFERMRVLNRSPQNDRLRVILVLVPIRIKPPHTPSVSANRRTNDTIFVASM